MIVRFNKEDRSTFPYWFAHWCAYNMVALNMKIWKPKYLLHDIEKPWMMLWYKYILRKENPYQYVQKWHRSHNRHHIEYCPPYKRDYEAMLIDWECGMFTKTTSPLNAIEELEKQYSEGNINNIEYSFIKHIGEKFGFDYKNKS